MVANGWRDRSPPCPRRTPPAGLLRSRPHCRRWRHSRCGDIHLPEPKWLLVSPVDESHNMKNKNACSICCCNLLAQKTVSQLTPVPLRNVSLCIVGVKFIVSSVFGRKHRKSVQLVPFLVHSSMSPVRGGASCAPYWELQSHSCLLAAP